MSIPDPKTAPTGTSDLIREICGDELNGGLIRDLCFTVWSLCRYPTHADGKTDWGNDTLPTVQKAVSIVREKLAAVAPAQCDVLTAQEPVAWIAFAENGNVRFWTSDPHRTQREKERGLDLRAFTMPELIALISRLPAPSSLPEKAEGQTPLDWLADHKNYELSFSGYDEDPAWLVHSVNGGRNDREWTLLATGDTPEKALRKAMSLALSSADRGRE
jgi:hypothetical protein